MSRYRLDKDEHGYFLSDTFSRQRSLRANFDEPSFLRRVGRAGKKNELVAKSVKVKPGLKVLDCTAGLGRDSFILAHLGCDVTMCERSSVLHCLLEDALTRAKHDERLAETTARMSLIKDDALSLLERSGGEFNVIYLDPMFPERTGSAAVKGGMQYLQRFIGVDRDSEDLLRAALSTSDTRVVLKRPAHGGLIKLNVAPQHVFKNRNSRYEVYLTAASASAAST
ncbi:MAG: class I SAM-dependent methyltransferase [Pseudomonadales bacterium]|nr:class I SAM-dependent methyltransferase [Pseudomonadales bacterium]